MYRWFGNVTHSNRPQPRGGYLLTYFYHTATLAIGYHADIHSIASVDDKHDFIAKEAHNMFSNAGTNIDLEQAKYFIN